jgi:hypothetical protein
MFAENVAHNLCCQIRADDNSSTCTFNAVRVLRDKGITLNRGKCQLNMSQVVFMGHVLSDHRVGPAKVKVKAVVEVREPMTAAEVRSFLGLVNYSAIFIPDLATVSAPFREHTVRIMSLDRVNRNRNCLMSLRNVSRS